MIHRSSIKFLLQLLVLASSLCLGFVPRDQKAAAWNPKPELEPETSDHNKPTEIKPVEMNSLKFLFFMAQPYYGPVADMTPAQRENYEAYQRFVVDPYILIFGKRPSNVHYIPRKSEYGSRPIYFPPIKQRKRAVRDLVPENSDVLAPANATNGTSHQQRPSHGIAYPLRSGLSLAPVWKVFFPTAKRLGRNQTSYQQHVVSTNASGEALPPPGPDFANVLRSGLLNSPSMWRGFFRSAKRPARSGGNPNENHFPTSANANSSTGGTLSAQDNPSRQIYKRSGATIPVVPEGSRNHHWNRHRYDVPQIGF